MTPNWKRFQKIVSNMIENDLGAEPLEITTPGEITYDFDKGEVQLEPTVENIKSALIPTNKDDLKDLPEGLRDKVIRKLFTVKPIAKNATIKSLFDNVEYEVIVPSAAYQAGGLTHCYRTFLGRIENQELDEDIEDTGDNTEDG